MKYDQGREYASVAGTVEGSILVADANFDCLTEGERCEVKLDTDSNLYVVCANGQHNLDGHLNDEETHYIGFYPAPPQ